MSKQKHDSKLMKIAHMCTQVTTKHLSTKKHPTDKLVTKFL